MPPKDSYRIIDANFNRAKEGLRVCEEISRFHMKSTLLTKRLSRLRHRLTDTIKAAKIDQLMLFKQRDAKKDLGRDFSRGPKKRSFQDLFLANSQRVKEALRVLEEFLKLFDLSASKKIQKLRFAFYTLEKETVEEFPALLDPR